jgi:hypothetical protein
METRHIEISGNVALSLSTLTFEYNALEFFEDNELLVGVIHFGVALLFADQKAGLFQPLQFALDVPRIFFNKFGEAPDVRLEIGIFRIDYNNLAADS